MLGRTGTQHSPGLNPVPKLNTSPSYRQRFNAPPLNLIASALFPYFRQGFQKKAYKEKKAGSYSVLIITKRNCILPSYWNLPQGSVVVFLVFCKKEKKKKTENSNSQCSADVKLKEESCRSLACFHNRSTDHLSGDTGHNSTGNCETHSVVKVRAESLLHMGKCNISSLSLEPSSLDTINILIIG